MNQTSSGEVKPPKSSPIDTVLLCLLTLGVVMLFWGATTPSSSRDSVQRLLAFEGELFAMVDWECDNNLVASGCSIVSSEYFKTSDGETWIPAKLPKEALWENSTTTSLPWGEGELQLKGAQVVADDPALSWSINSDRKQFMRGWGGYEWQAVDMAAVPKFPKRVVVALETEGILLLNSQGEWSRHALGEVSPTPSQLSLQYSFRRAALHHWLFGIAATFITWILACLLSWRSYREEVLPAARLHNAKSGVATNVYRFLQGACSSFTNAVGGSGHILRTITALVLPLLIYIRYLVPGRLNIPILDLPYILIFSVPALGIGLGWREFRRKQPRYRGSIHLLASLPAGIIAIGLLVFCDLAWIESLQVAVSLAAVGIVANLIFIAARLGSR